MRRVISLAVFVRSMVASFLARWVALFPFVYPCVMEGMPGGTSARPRQGGP